MTEFIITTKDIVLREDAKDIIIEQDKKHITTAIMYISESHEHKSCVHVEQGLWELDKINNNIVTLK